MTPITYALAYLMDKGHKYLMARAARRAESQAWNDFQSRYSEQGVTATREIGALRKAKHKALNAALKGDA